MPLSKEDSLTSPSVGGRSRLGWDVVVVVAVICLKVEARNAILRIAEDIFKRFIGYFKIFLALCILQA